MNSIQEINRINQRELDLGLTGSASWHHQYSQSAYVHVGGLSYEMTEGDVLTVFSQFGEIMDINMPRDQDSGKPRGFAFLMYEDQRSTVLAVDNMNGALVLGRMLKVDHVHKYEQPGKRDEEGKYQKPEEPTYNAMPPELSGSDDSSGSEPDNDPSIDGDDPMAAFLRAERKKNKPKKKSGEGKEEKRRRKEERRRIREERERKKMIKALKGKERGGGREAGDRDGRGEERGGRGGSAVERESRERSRSKRSMTRSPKREDLSPGRQGQPHTGSRRSDGGISNGLGGEGVRAERGERDTHGSRSERDAYAAREGRKPSPLPMGDRRDRRIVPDDRRRSREREESPPRRNGNGHRDGRYDHPRDRRDDDYNRRERR